VNANSSAAQDRVAGTELYRELVRRCRAAGVLRPTPLVDVIRSVAVMSLYASAFGALLTAPAWPARLALLAVTAFASVQAGMIGHDAGHGAFAWSPGQFGWPGHLFLTIGAGWPFAHWIAAHHGHHRHTNEDGRDPDMRDGLFSLSHRQAEGKRGWLGLTTRYQHLLVWPLATLMAFSIRARAMAFVWRGGRATRVDRLVTMAQLGIWIGVPALVIGPVAAVVNYLLWTWFMGPYLMVSFFWNHVGTRAVDPGEKLPFFQQRLQCTRSLGSHWVATMLFGGLNLHIEHHLLPAVPIARLARAQQILMQLCAEHGLAYRAQGYREAMAGVYAHFRAVGRNVPREVTGRASPVRAR
jgi:fatty acid desaturase